MDQNLKTHWEKIYEVKASHELTWAQEVPETSLDFIRSFDLPKTASIIDIGGGDSRLVDHLLKEGYSDITVLDISEQSLDRAKLRLGEEALKVKWIVGDVRAFRCEHPYDLWHDRAAFHFLITEEEVRSYLAMVRNCVSGYMVLGTFSTSGPTRCSGLPVHQYSDDQLTQLFMEGFSKIRCINVDHITPAKAVQNFTFCSFMKIKAA
ncbi:MAG TPA: class I SAM-dependent methyltransferase [Chitinophagaceae bacterium]|nr:class I SAM-dependent methyltransferase [Chitinophagaceae bacterium]